MEISLICDERVEGAVELALVTSFVAHGDVDVAADVVLGKVGADGGREGGIDAGDFVVEDVFVVQLGALDEPPGGGEDFDELLIVEVGWGPLGEVCGAEGLEVVGGVRGEDFRRIEAVFAVIGAGAALAFNGFGSMGEAAVGA